MKSHRKMNVIGIKTKMETENNDHAMIMTYPYIHKFTRAFTALSSSLTLTQQQQLERVQKKACEVILDPVHNTYDDALTTIL